jgi:SAM-dependent methyltransferase
MLDAPATPAETAGSRQLTPPMLPLWLRRVLRGRAKAIVRRSVCAGVDAWDAMAGRREPLLPPCHLRVRVGCFLSYLHVSHFRVVAGEFLDHLRELGGLRPSSRVLDIGCGCGQMAAPLTAVLSGAGSYDGFDPDREAIAWCHAHIAARFPRFRFTSADLENALYNPGGALRADRFQFPYADASFDVVLLKSVFTHLQAPALRQYLSEIRRLLAPGGRCLASFILLNPEADRLIEQGASTMAFRFEGDGCRLLDAATPEYKVAFDEAAVRAAASACGLAIDRIEYGAWCGRARHLSYQDLVVFTLPPPPSPS